MKKENTVKKKKWNSYLVIGAIMTGITLAIALIGAFWTPYEATAMSASEKFVGPSLRHLFGTDNFGRDIFSRVMEAVMNSISSQIPTINFSVLLCCTTSPFRRVQMFR